MKKEKNKIKLENEVSRISKKSNNKKFIIFIIILLILVIIATIIIMRNKKYETALEKIEMGEYETAYNMLKELGSRKAISKLKENKYDRAKDYLKEDDEISALILFNEILDYKDSKEHQDKILNNKEYLKMFISKEGDEIFFGKYEQDNNLTDKEQLEWIIIYNNNKKVYMVSKNIIDAKEYNTANGDGSTLKKWLKEDFPNEAFNDEERQYISHVGLLSREDMKQYSEIVNITPQWTKYAMAQEPNYGYKSGYSWWLAGDYFHGVATTDVSMYVVIASGGFSNYVAAVTEKNGVRPAIIIDLNDNNIDYYAEDYFDIENSGIVTRTQEDIDKTVKDITGKNTSKSTTNSVPGSKRVVCPRCNGRGKYKTWNGKEETRCSTCGGTGYKYK